MSLRKSLEALGRLLAAGMRDRLGRLGVKDGGNSALGKSIRYEVEPKGDNSYNLVRYMNYYGNFVDSGVRGTKDGYPASQESLFQIGQFKKPIISRESGLPIPVRISIAQNGLKPKPFIVPSINTVMNQVGYEMIAEGAAEDVTVSIDNAIKDMKFNI